MHNSRVYSYTIYTELTLLVSVLNRAAKTHTKTTRNDVRAFSHETANVAYSFQVVNDPVFLHKI